jgi:hypothetical protein
VPLLTLRRFAAWFLRDRPGSRCAHCMIPWAYGPAWLGSLPHNLMYEELSPGGVRNGLFMTCEWCWPRTTLDQRARYLYDLVMITWRSGAAPMQVDECLRIMRLVRPVLAQGAAPSRESR